MRTIRRIQAWKAWRAALHVDCGGNSPRAGVEEGGPGVEEMGRKARVGRGGSRGQWVGESCPFIFRKHQEATWAEGRGG